MKSRKISLFDYDEEVIKKPQNKWPKKPFIIKESYKHKFAKQILFEWLVQAEEESFRLSQIEQKKTGNEFAYVYCKFEPFHWRQNWGVHLELPFYKTSDPYYFEISKDKDDDTPIFIPDITIFHKGTPIYLIEVVHKNHITPGKIISIEQFFEGYPFQLHEVEAETILMQIKKPKYIKTNLIINNS